MSLIYLDVPRFRKIYDDYGIDPSVSVRRIFAASDYAMDHFYSFVALLTAALASGEILLLRALQRSSTKSLGRCGSVLVMIVSMAIIVYSFFALWFPVMNPHRLSG